MARARGSKRGFRFGNGILAGTCIAGACALAFYQTASAALLPTVVFDDTLATNGSTVGSASQSYSNTATPTATSTNYDIASNKEAVGGTPSSTLSMGGPLQLSMVSTSSGINEVQALFTSNPVVLTNIGDSIEITTTFNNTTGLNQKSSSAVYLGLYNSGGSAPYNNLTNGSSTANTVTGIGNTEINDNTGGVAGWVGYESDDFGSGSSSKLYTRPAESPSLGSDDNQALVGEGQSGGSSGGLAATYTSQESGANLSTTSGSNTYTDELTITLTASGVYTLSNAMYAGSSDTGTPIGSPNGNATVGTLAALTGGTGFDGFSIGYRQSNSTASEMDIESVEVTVPEPASIGLLGLASLGLLRRKRRA